MKKLMLLALAATALSGCATITANKDKVAAAKRVAIIGYGGQLNLEDNQQKSGIAATVGAIKGANDLFSGKLDERRREQATISYGVLGQKLGAALGWEVLPPETVAASPEYGQLLRNAGSMYKGMGYQYVDVILPPAQANRLNAQNRQVLAASLGVDAMAIVDVQYYVGDRGGFAIGGIGSTTVFPQAIINFTVVDNAGEVIWRDMRAVGAVTKEGLRTTMGAEIVANETEVLNEAASTAFDALIARYQAFQPKQ
jgi:hypothetical protein